jgi:hypothetical protein
LTENAFCGIKLLNKRQIAEALATEGQEVFMALWREVPGYEGLYLVSDEGDILSLPRVVSNGRGCWVKPGRILKPGLRGNEWLKYEFVILTTAEGKARHESVHRLVAEAFVSKPDGCNHVNHIDHDTLNNRAENLEWCTQQYNNEYGHNKPVAQYTEDGELVAKYKNITYASEITGIGRTAINNCLSGWSGSSGGYVWKYEQD